MTATKAKYKGSLTNFTDGNHNVFDPLYNLSKDSWYVVLRHQTLGLD
jgi:hypothetical protein